MDQRLRELERRWATTRAVEDGAAYLAERLRLEPGPSPEPGPDDLRTRMAAAIHCGDPVACGALGGPGAATHPLVAWTAGLAAISRRAAVAAALRVAHPSAAGTAWPEWRYELAGVCRPDEALEQLGRWLEGQTLVDLTPAVNRMDYAEGVLRNTARAGRRTAEQCLGDAVQSAGASTLRRALQVAIDPDPGRRLAEAISCAAFVARGEVSSWARAEALFAALDGMDNGGIPPFALVRDALVLDQARLAVGAWALRGLLPERS